MNGVKKSPQRRGPDKQCQKNIMQNAENGTPKRWNNSEAKKAPVRIGGVYTLVGLVDEWLLDENLDYTEKVREGQVIINSLCAYIRSSFALAFHYDELTQDSPIAEGLYKNREQEFYTDKAALESEANIRLSILKEIRHRLQGPDKNTPGTWSDFEYDFSGSTFFYPVDLTHSY